MQKLQETITQLRIYAMNISKGILLTFNTFSKPLTEISITYGKPEDYKHIDNLYNLTEISGSKDTFSKCCNLMDYLCSHVLHYSHYDNHLGGDLLKILETTWDNECREESINCLYLSFVLRSFFQSQGIKARSVSAFPCSPYGTDNHVVVEAWLPEYNKWVMFDPTHNTYLKNSAGTLLSCKEIRQILAQNEKIIFAPTTSYNKKLYDKDRLLDLESYFACDFFFFMIRDSQSLRDKEVRRIVIAPDGYDLDIYQKRKEFKLENIIYNPISFMDRE